MPQIVRNIRHHDTIARLGPRGFELVKDHRCGPTCSCRRPAARDAMADLRRAATKAVAACDRLDRRLTNTADSLGALAPKLYRVADARRAMRDAERGRAAAPGGIASATSGYVRDAAGNRIRPMTTADLAAIHRDHYRRGQATPPVADTQPASAKRPVTPADLQARHDAFYERAR